MHGTTNIKHIKSSCKIYPDMFRITNILINIELWVHELVIIEISHTFLNFTLTFTFIAQLRCILYLRSTKIGRQNFVIVYSNLTNVFSRGADKSLARPDWKKTIEKSQFFIRRRRHWCRGDLVGRTTFWIFFFLEWLAKVRVWSL